MQQDGRRAVAKALRQLRRGEYQGAIVTLQRLIDFWDAHAPEPPEVDEEARTTRYTTPR